ncbi:MAG TPA: hypothetical protein VF119_08480 [Candidatus Limnocylindrales bacterium]
MPTPNHYTTGRFALEIDGTAVGFVSAMRGGEAFAQAISTPTSSGVIDKRPGGVQYAPIVLEVDTFLGAAFYDRIASFLGGSPKPMSGLIRILDADLAERSRLEWTDGLITEVAFPAADGGSKDPAQLRVTIQPGSTRRGAGSGKTVPGGISTKRKRWLASNFRFSIVGLENATKRVARVESLVLRRPATEAPRALVAGPLEVPDVVFTVAASDGTTFYDWFDDFIVKGNDSADNERSGSLVFLDATLKEPLIGLAMQGLGILRVSAERAEPGSDAIALVRVELYCERMELSPAPV